MNHSEHAPLYAHTDATITRAAVIEERGELQGVYTVECLKPLPGHEADFLPLWNRRVELERRLHGRLARYLPLYAKILAAELEAVTLQLREHQYLAWADTARNTVCTVGKNLALDTFLAGSGYSVTGPYLGLISLVGFSATAAGDTMTAHAGWTEAGGANAPTYTAPRKTAAWNAAAAGIKALAAPLTYPITGPGTVKGAFLVYGSGAVSTLDNTGGVLMSAGLFAGGDKPVAALDQLNVNYSLTF